MYPMRNMLKIEPKSISFIFMEYSENSKAYRFYNRNTQQLDISRDAIFVEDNKEISKSSLIINSNDSQNEENKESLETPIKRSIRIIKPHIHLVHSGVLSQDMLENIKEPNTYEEAIENNHSDKWIKAMNDEINAIKARIVDKGYSQIEGVDYFDPFALVIKLSSARVILVLANIKGWVIHQIEVILAFLNGDLQEEV